MLEYSIRGISLRVEPDASLTSQWLGRTSLSDFERKL
jgi:hypothetical protein